MTLLSFYVKYLTSSIGSQIPLFDDCKFFIFISSFPNSTGKIRQEKTQIKNHTINLITFMSKITLNINNRTTMLNKSPLLIFGNNSGVLRYRFVVAGLSKVESVFNHSRRIYLPLLPTPNYPNQYSL